MKNVWLLGYWEGHVLTMSHILPLDTPHAFEDGTRPLQLHLRQIERHLKFKQYQRKNRDTCFVETGHVWHCHPDQVDGSTLVRPWRLVLSSLEVQSSLDGRITHVVIGVWRGRRWQGPPVVEPFIPGQGTTGEITIIGRGAEHCLNVKWHEFSPSPNGLKLTRPPQLVTSSLSLYNI